MTDEAVYTLIVTSDDDEPAVTVAHMGRFLTDRDALALLVIAKSYLDRKLRPPLPGHRS